MMGSLKARTGLLAAAVVGCMAVLSVPVPLSAQTTPQNLRIGLGSDPDALDPKWVDAVENQEALAATGHSLEENLRHVPPDYSQYLNRFFDNFLSHAGLIGTPGAA